MVKLIILNTLEEFDVCALEISHDNNSFTGIIKLETKIDLCDDLFYIKIREENYEEKYYLKFICDCYEEECLYYFEGIDWTKKFNF
jgi:hypothetical protein